MHLFDNKLSAKCIQINGYNNFLSYFGTYGVIKTKEYHTTSFDIPGVIPASFFKFVDAWWEKHHFIYIENKIKNFYGNSSKFLITNPPKILENIHEDMLLEMILDNERKKYDFMENSPQAI